VEIEEHSIKTKSGLKRTVVKNGVGQVALGDLLAGFQENRTVQILFEELFYNKDYKPFRVLCIELPLEGGSQKVGRRFALLTTWRNLNQP
jgi:hypothetical protein